MQHVLYIPECKLCYKKIENIILEKPEILKNTKLCSFNISNTYTNVTIKETIEVNKLKNNFNSQYIKQKNKTKI